MNLNNISIRSQLFFLVGLLLLLMLAVGGLGIQHLSTANRDFASVFNDRVVPLKQLKVVADMYAVNIVDTAHKTRNQNLTFAQGIANIDEAQHKIVDNWKAYELTYMDAEERKLADDAEKLMKVADQGIVRLKGIMQAQDQEGIASFSMHELYPAIDPISSKISELVDLQLKRAEDGYRHAEQEYIVARNQAVGLLFLAVLIGLVVGKLILNAINQPLALANEAAQRIAKGDLSGKVAASGSNETGRLLAAIGEMQKELELMINEIQRGVSEVSASASQLAAASKQVSTSSAQQSDATSAVAAAVEELTVSIDHVAANAAEAEQKSSQSGKLSHSGGQQVNEATEEMARIAESVNETAQEISALGIQAQQIDSIVGVIKDVAEQTNLLALNAAIEAARAGEQGRGFAVVADEVRKLAERTATSAQEITSMVGNIQSHTGSAVASMEKGSSRVAQGVMLTERAGLSMHEISDSSEAVVLAVADISNALNEQKSTSSEIARNVENIAQMTEENRQAVSEVASAANRLESLSVKLQQAVTGFRVEAGA
jgi:methyl-accepting chemotaxis protein